MKRTIRKKLNILLFNPFISSTSGFGIFFMYMITTKNVFFSLFLACYASCLLNCMLNKIDEERK